MPLENSNDSEETTRDSEVSEIDDSNETIDKSTSLAFVNGMYLSTHIIM